MFLFFIFLFLFNSLEGQLAPANRIYVFGDSHSEEFIGIPGCEYCNVGSVTMHRVGRDRGEVLNFKNYRFFPGDVLVFTFGQIDVGWHISKIRNKTGRELNEILSTLSREYISAIQQITSPFPEIVKIIYSITPPTNNTNIPHIPYVGSLTERVLITKILNKMLEDLCVKNNMVFLDVYDDYSNDLGVLKPEISDGSHHIHYIYNEAIRKKLYKVIFEHQYSQTD